MNFAFHMRQPFTKTVAMATAVRRGASVHGDTVQILEGYTGVADVEGLILFGIGGHSRHIWDDYDGKHRILIDKGYSRMPYYRVAINYFQPLAYMDRIQRPDDRLARLGIKFQKYKGEGDAILFDGASNKYCLWMGLGDWIAWGESMVAKIRHHTDRPIIYRPRPSHNEPVSINGAELSGGPLADDLARSAVVVSYGGNIGWDAAISGVSHFAIGDSIARPISETVWERLDDPLIPDKRNAWAANVAYCQWTIDELSSGEAWGYIRQEINRDKL